MMIFTVIAGSIVDVVLTLIYDMTACIACANNSLSGACVGATCDRAIPSATTTPNPNIAPCIASSAVVTTLDILVTWIDVFESGFNMV